MYWIFGFWWERKNGLFPTEKALMGSIRQSVYSNHIRRRVHRPWIDLGEDASVEDQCTNQCAILAFWILIFNKGRFFNLSFLPWFCYCYFWMFAYFSNEWRKLTLTLPLNLHQLFQVFGILRQSRNNPIWTPAHIFSLWRAAKLCRLLCILICF